MRRMAVTALVVALALGASVPASATTDFLSKYASGRLPKIKAPDVEVKVLANGMRLYLLEDHTLPIVKVGAIIRTGSIYDPPELIGLADLAGMLMRSGGAGERSPQEFDKALDDMGADLACGMGDEMGNAYLNVLSGDLERGLELMFDMLLKPRFDPARLVVAKHNMLEALRREDDDPQSLAAYKFTQLIYGEGSPWARRPDSASIARITPKEIRAFHDRYFKVDNMILVAAGDFKVRDMVRAIERLSKDAPRGKVEFPEVAQVKLEYKSAFEGIPRPLTQAFIRMGHLSVKRHNPEKYALFLADDILGASGFMSRLVKDVRTRRGLAYSIWSSLGVGTDYGLFYVGVNTKARNAERVISIVKDQIERIAVKGDVEQAELDLAKQSILARLIFQFDSPFKTVSESARFYFYGYPPDYWRVYRDRIAATTLDDVKAAAKKYMKPEDLEILVVGPASSFPKRSERE